MTKFNMIDNGTVDGKEDGKKIIMDAIDALPEDRTLGYILFAAVLDEKKEKLNMVIKDIGMPKEALIFVAYAAMEGARHLAGEETDPEATFEDHKVQ